MPLRLITGNLFDSSADLYVHGCNTQGKMNSGIARQIRERFPSAYADYMDKYKRHGWQLGDIQYSRTTCEKPRFIVNCATQNRYGYDGRQYADYKAIQECLTHVVRFASRENYSIAMPRIGCGLGGLNWTTVFTIIDKISMAYPDVIIEIYSQENNYDS